MLIILNRILTLISLISIYLFKTHFIILIRRCCFGLGLSPTSRSQDSPDSRKTSYCTTTFKIVPLRSKLLHGAILYVFQQDILAALLSCSITRKLVILMIASDRLKMQRWSPRVGKVLCMFLKLFFKTNYAEDVYSP